MVNAHNNEAKRGCRSLRESEAELAAEGNLSARQGGLDSGSPNRSRAASPSETTPYIGIV